MQNFIMPEHCNQVSVRRVRDIDNLDIDGKRVFLRTKYILFTDGMKWTVARVVLKKTMELLRPVREMEIISKPEETRFVHAPHIDVMNACAMLSEAVGDKKTLIVRGKWGLYSFVKIVGEVKKIAVVDVVPPFPSRIETLVFECFSGISFSGINIEPFAIIREYINLNEIKVHDECIVLPCPVEGYSTNKKVYYASDNALPPVPGTLIGCRLTEKITRGKFKMISVCPLERAEEMNSKLPVLTRCCEILRGVKKIGNIYCLPYGCTSREVLLALRGIFSHPNRH